MVAFAILESRPALLRPFDFGLDVRAGLHHDRLGRWRCCACGAGLCQSDALPPFSQGSRCVPAFPRRGCRPFPMHLTSCRAAATALQSPPARALSLFPVVVPAQAIGIPIPMVEAAQGPGTAMRCTPLIGVIMMCFASRALAVRALPV